MCLLCAESLSLSLSQDNDDDSGPVVLVLALRELQRKEDKGRMR